MTDAVVMASEIKPLDIVEDRRKNIVNVESVELVSHEAGGKWITIQGTVLEYGSDQFKKMMPGGFYYVESSPDCEYKLIERK